MKVFVTGITGNVGINLTEALLTAGYDVIGFVRKDVKTRKPEIFNYLNKAKLKLVYGDITDLNSVTKALDSVTGEREISIINLAAVIESKNPVLFQNVNVMGVENICKAALHSKSSIDHIIHFSTAAVHGPNHPNETITENTSFLPETPYEKSKHQGEEVARKFIEGEKLPITILRPVHVYGPNFHDALLIRMIKMVSRRFVIAPPNLPLDLVCVKNLIFATILALENKKSIGQTYLINDGKNYTTEDVITVLKSIFQNDPTIIQIPKPLTRLYSKITKSFRYGLNNISYSCDKIVKQLNYKPKITLKEGLTEYVSWLSTNGQIDSQYIINKYEALRESLFRGKGIGCAYDYIVRNRSLMYLYKRAIQINRNPSILLVIPFMTFCPPVEMEYLKRKVKNLNLKKTVIPYENPTSLHIQKYLNKHKDKKYDLSVFIGEDIEFEALRSLTRILRNISAYVGVFVHNGDNTYHIGNWKGIKAKDASSLKPIKKEYIDIPLIPANIQIKTFHNKSQSKIKNIFQFSIGLTILLISELEKKFPKFVKKRMAHQLFLVWQQ